MARAVPDRFRWALSALMPQPAEHILEVGCGTGVAAALILPRLDSGSLTAIDRSAAAIEKARQRNRDAIAAGRLRLLSQPLATADIGAARFEQALAINVNVFWIEPEAPLAVLAAVLKPAGRVHLVYQPPAAEQARRIGERCAEALDRHGFRNIEISLRQSAAATGVCISARHR